MANLNDVNISNITTGQILEYNSTSGKFEPTSIADAGTDDQNITDFNITNNILSITLEDGNTVDVNLTRDLNLTRIFSENNTTEIFQDANVTMSDIGDVNTSGILTGQVLIYNTASGKFEPTTITGTTNLTIANRNANTLDMNSSTGLGVTIPEANATLSGLLGSNDKEKLNYITATQNINLDNLTGAMKFIGDWNASSGTGIDGRESHLYHCYVDAKKTKKAIQQCECVKGLYVLPTHVDLIGVEVELMNEKRREMFLRGIIDKVATDYDYIFIDCDWDSESIIMEAYKRYEYPSFAVFQQRFFV